MAALAWLSAALPLAAQTTGVPERWSELADTIFRNFGRDEGLPTAAVTAVAEDGDGFLWVGTQGGLSRWDGYHFHTYRANTVDPRALQNDFVWSLKTDRQGRLWIGTNGGGVSRYDKATDSFMTVALGPTGRTNLPIRSLAEDDAGGMWVGNDQGLYHLGPDGGVLSHERHDDADRASLPGDQVLALLSDSAGRLWIGTDNGLARRDKQADPLSAVEIAAAGTPAPAIDGLFKASDGRLWIGTRNDGAYALDPSGRSVHAILPGPERLTTAAMAEPTPGTIWFGTDGKGILSLNAATGHVSHIHHDSARTTSLPHDLIWCLYRDRSGTLWAGTYYGLGLHVTSQDAILTAFGGSNQTQGLTGADVLATLATREGKVWVTYLTGGADILDPATHRINSLRTDPAHPETSLPPDRIRAAVQSGNGDIYLGTYHGLYRATPAADSITHIPLAGDTPNPRILALMSDETGVWFGTYGRGLWHIENGSGKPRRYATGELSDQWITTIAPVGDGRLWVGSYQGLYILDPDSGHIQQALPDRQDGQPQRGGLISSLLKDRRGRLWVGTLDGGIAVSDGFETDGRPRFRRVAMPGDVVFVGTVLEDKAGAIWANSGDNNIVRIDPDTFTVRVFQHADGVGLQGFEMNSGSTTPAGEVLFGGDGGMIIVRPDRLTSWNYHPPIVVTDLRIGGHQVPLHEINGPGDKGLIQVQPDANSLSVEFAALDYSAPALNRYAYRLEGYDADWVTTDATRRLASYTNLSPRRYTLHLRGSNREGVWSETTLDIPIEVLPAWYQTVLFKLGVAVLGMLGIWLLVRGRTTYLRHRQIVLEQQVAQRTTELRLANDQLEARTDELAESLREVAESRAKVANLLDTSGQGFLSFGADLIIEPDCSRACASMLGRAPEGHPADVILFGHDPGKMELFAKVISGALASSDGFKRDLLFSLLPSTIERRGRLLKVEYRQLDNGHVMVVLTDVTEEHRLSRKVENERLRLAMIVMAVTESRDFFDAVEAYKRFFRQELMEILAARSSPYSIHQEIYRQVHTLKGTLAQFCFDSAPKMLHGLEESLSDLKREQEIMTTGKIVELVLSFDHHGALETDLGALRDALGEEFLDHGKGVFLPISQARKLRAVTERLLAGESLDLTSEETVALFNEFRNLDKVALADALAHYDHVVGQVAKRLNKEMAPVGIDGGEDLWLDPDLYGSFLRSLVHIFRNAVVHGIEDPETRLANGKNPAGRIDCTIRVQGSAFTLMIADDGAGIDADTLREKAVSLDLISEERAVALTDDEAVALIFADDVSVRNQADELAGRGVGLSAVRAEAEALGGRIVVTSLPGHGTRFEFFLPLPDSIDDRELIDAGSA